MGWDPYLRLVRALRAGRALLPRLDAGLRLAFTTALRRTVPRLATPGLLYPVCAMCAPLRNAVIEHKEHYAHVQFVINQ